MSQDTLDHLKPCFSVGMLKINTSAPDDGNYFEEEIVEVEKEIREKKSYTATRLFTHNIDVDTINDEALDALELDEAEYFMEGTGRPALVESLKKSCLAPELLRLKVGAKVMFVKNNFEADYVNGTLGTVIEALPDQPPVVKTLSGKKIMLEMASWCIEEDGKVKAEIRQYPLRLAWAITVHKSQGMSLDAVEVDLSKSFEPGMGYVALSRVRDFKNLTILGLNNVALRVHDEVLMVDEKLKTASERAIEEFEVLQEKKGKNEITRLQKEFLKKIAPAVKEKKKPTHVLTQELILERKNLKEIAKARGVTEETIIDHIEKIIDEENPHAEPFRNLARYLLYEVSKKKQQAIRIGFMQKYPKISANIPKEAQDPSSPDFDFSIFRKEPIGPIKHAVKGVSYKEIRLVRALWPMV
ncbi:MAG: helix-turn-helix domain-containing protein [Candidatus Pacebacteria bacterium]|nr:helix-turn-helix domain-containing protein [Candidatus Paceibacterota bacterium]